MLLNAARAAPAVDAGHCPHEIAMLGGSLLSDTPPLPPDQGIFVASKTLGLGLNECERALLECLPVVLHDATYRKLFALGIHGDGVNGHGPFDALLVEVVVFLPDERFEFALDMRDTSGAVKAVIIPAPDEDGELVDLCAWEPGSKRFGRWRGVASMLGANNVYAPRLGEPLLVHESIADWLRAERRGVFVIDPKRAAPLLHLAPPLGVQREAFGRRLRAALTIAAPRIVVATAMRRAA